MQQEGIIANVVKNVTNMKIVTDKREYCLVMSEIESYLQKGFDALSPDEEERLNEPSTAAEEWELSSYPMPANPKERTSSFSSCINGK